MESRVSRSAHRRFRLSTFEFSGLDDLLEFGNLEFNLSGIIDSLVRLSDFLSQYEQFSFLDTPIPLVNVSVNDVLSFADQLADAIDSLQRNPAGTIQLLENKLKEAFGMLGGAELSAIGFPDSLSSPAGVGELVADSVVSEFSSDNLVFLLAVANRPARLLNVQPASSRAALAANIHTAINDVFGPSSNLVAEVNVDDKIVIRSTAPTPSRWPSLI